jgi:Spy/CpxP family protein refolding chaperone
MNARNAFLAGLAGAVLLLTAIAPAQGAGPRGGAAGQGDRAQMAKKAQETHQKVLAQLNLTQQQRAQVAELDKKREAQMKALRDKNKNAPQGKNDARREEMRKIQEDYRANFEKIVGPDNAKKYRDLIRAEMQKNGANRPGRPGTKPTNP